MATLKDVASRAGVSIATVSYYINGTHNLSPDTRARVAQAIEELHYIPNAQAQSLKSRTSRELCVIFPTLDNLCYNEFLNGILMQSESAGYTVNTSCSYNDISKEQELLRNAISKNYAGILLVTCQPQNTAFFRDILHKHPLNIVFLDQLPNKVDAIYFGFDNYNTMHYLTSELIKNGYQDIALLTGSDTYFSESECIAGYQDAMDSANLTIPPFRQLCTDTTKEGAFSTFLQHWTVHPPQAVITSSQALCQGVIEGCNLIRCRIPEDICIITLDVDNWNRSSFYPDIIRTTRPAYLLGSESCKALVQVAEQSGTPESRFHILHDTITDYPLDPPSAAIRSFPEISPQKERTLRIAAADLPTIHAIEAVSSDFYARYKLHLEFEMMDLKDLFSVILTDAVKEQPEFDIYLYDTSWFSYLHHAQVLRDLTEEFYSAPEFRRYFVQKNLSNCCRDGRYYGFPVIGGTQFLLYRKDLFNNPALAQQYKQNHKFSLRPPKTWKEFNAIARFFTREYNPDSPTMYGTGIAWDLNEELALELEPRMWSYGGGFYDAAGRLNLNSPQNVQAVNSLMESLQYSKIGLSSNQEVFSAFTRGEIAMVTTFTEYATQLQNTSHSEYLHRNGYSMIPGQIPTNVGWHFGVPKNCPKLAEILQFFHWLYRRHTSYYLSIIGGSSALIFPYKNHELKKMYPWIDLTSDSIDNCRSRNYPTRKVSGLLAPNEFEAILCDQLRTRPQNPQEISACLTRMQEELIQSLTH